MSVVRLFLLPVIKTESLQVKGAEDKWKELLCCMVLCYFVLSLLRDVILLPTVQLDFKRVVHKH